MTDKVRMGHDWSNAPRGLEQLLVNPGVDKFSRLLAPGAYMAGSEFQDCLPRRLVSPASRRYLGVRRPVSGLLGAHLFLPFGSEPSPGRHGGCVKGVIRIAG